jgi:hypothetical protein
MFHSNPYDRLFGPFGVPEAISCTIHHLRVLQFPISVSMPRHQQMDVQK